MTNAQSTRPENMGRASHDHEQNVHWENLRDSCVNQPLMEVPFFAPLGFDASLLPLGRLPPVHSGSLHRRPGAGPRGLPARNDRRGCGTARRRDFPEDGRISAPRMADRVLQTTSRGGCLRCRRNRGRHGLSGTCSQGGRSFALNENCSLRHAQVPRSRLTIPHPGRSCSSGP